MEASVTIDSPQQIRGNLGIVIDGIQTHLSELIGGSTEKEITVTYVTCLSSCIFKFSETKKNDDGSISYSIELPK
jgi:hypothetical protein